MRVIQISDCHLPGRPGELYRGRDARAALEGVLTAVRAWGPDLILATGDLSEDGSAESYAWLSGRLSRLEVPVLALPGNHDDAGVLERWLPDTAVEAPLVSRGGGWRFVLLNSAVPGEVPGRFSDAALEALDETLGMLDAPTLVALHHQPLPVGSHWIDRYPLLDPQGFWDVIGRHDVVRVVTWGHVHQAIELDRNGVIALGCPSTVSNSLPGCERFTEDAAGPACRWLRLGRGGRVETGVLLAAG